MGSLTILSSVVEQSQVSPPPATVGDTSLVLTFSDIQFLTGQPLHHLSFYELPLITKTNFVQTIATSIKHSLSLALQHFPLFAGNLILFPTSDRIPEIRYVDEEDFVKVTFAECNLDFNDLTGYHPRNCDKFYHLIPQLGKSLKISSDYIKIPVFTVQVTLFPNHGISIGITSHHSLGDATTLFSFFNAWASIARCGTDDSFLAIGILPLYDRLLKYPNLDETFFKKAFIKTSIEEYQPAYLFGPSDKVRATFVLTRTIIHRLKKLVSTRNPTLQYVSSFTVTCAYTWYCIAKSRNIDEINIFGFGMDIRSRLDPPIPVTYFGNCLKGCFTVLKTDRLMGNDGFLTAAKLIGENIHRILRHKDVDGMMNEERFNEEPYCEGMQTTVIGVAGTPKFNVYDLDFGWGKPKKVETVSIDYSGSISIDASKESDEDVEIGVCLTATEMQAFVTIFNQGVEINI